MLSCGVLLALLSKRCKLRLAGSQALQNTLPYLKPTGAGPWRPNNCCGSPCLRLAILLLLLLLVVVVVAAVVVVVVVVVVSGQKRPGSCCQGQGRRLCLAQSPVVLPSTSWLLCSPTLPLAASPACPALQAC